MVLHRILPPLLISLLVITACGDDGANPGSGEDPPEPEMDAGGEPDVVEPEEDAVEGEDTAPDVPEMVCELPDVADEAGLVATDKGFVKGVMDGTVWVWRGIPFATPPVDDLRWKPTQEAECWDEVLDASEFGAKCPQLSITLRGVETVGDEDCLTLNVWSPVEASDGTKRPVLFFIHGGGNIVGSASQEPFPGTFIYTGKHLAERGDAVVVTIQYRLGPLGFMTTPGLDAESDTGTSGNYAHLDQIAALEWVRDNIEAFGGDPSRVMVFGESAGAVNTCAMLTSPLSEGLFHGALMQSGSCPGTPGAAAQQGSAEAVALAGCEGSEDELACMRDVDALALVEVASGSVGIGASPTDNGLSWGPTIDGHVLPEAPIERIRAGRHHQVPFIIGSNADEMASRQINRVQVNTAEAYETAVRTVLRVFGNDAIERVLEAYPVEDFETPNDAFIQVTTDAVFTCSTRSVARAAASSEVAPVYRYFFTQRPTTNQGDGRASHGLELFYIFRSFEEIPRYNPAPGDIAVADAMMDAWLSFAESGDPGGGWATYEADEEETQVFGTPLSSQAGVRNGKCDLWDSILGQ